MVFANAMTIVAHSPRFMKKTLLYALALAVAATPAVMSAQQWQETNNLQSTLDDSWTYSSNAPALTGTVAFTNQIATNVGPTAEHMGMYLAWAWSYDASGANNPLLWSNGSNTFVGGPVSLTVTRPGFADEKLLLSTIANDTWIGVPWAPGAETAIASQGTWNAPFLDFGTIAAGASATYDITLAFTFDNQDAFDKWDRGGNFYLGGQGVQTVTPEPASIALMGFALLGLAIVVRRRNVKATGERRCLVA